MLSHKGAASLRLQRTFRTEIVSALYFGTSPNAVFVAGINPNTVNSA
jgi:hypothetical protein